MDAVRPLLAFCAAAAVVGGSSASATLLVVDSAEVVPFDFTSVTEAVAAAQNGDLIQVRPGLGPYEEQVIISPPPGEPASFALSVVGVPDTLTQELPQLHWSANLSNETEPDVEIIFQEAVVEIRNVEPNRCPDLRVSISNFSIYGEYEPGPETYGPGAIAVICAVDDTAQVYETRVDIAHNVLKADRAFMAAVALGAKDPVTIYEQSVVWGDVRYNTISNRSPDRGDGISSHHFIGHIENNWITSNSEGMHVGYGYLDPERHADPPSPAYLDGYTTMSILNNAVIHCLDEGIHFTQGSRGQVCNNIVHGVPMSEETPTLPHVWAWPNWTNHRTGIYVGTMQEEGHARGGRGGLSCDGLNKNVGEAVAAVYNNTFDNCRFGVKLSSYAELTLQNNIISRVTGPRSAGFLFLPDVNDDPPVNYQGGYNLFTPDVAYDYAPGRLRQVLADPNDIHAGEARFEGWQGPYNFSFMPQDTVALCYPAAPLVSDAIDRGNPDREFNDNDVDDGLPATAPAHGTARNDIGAYGGPFATWGEGDACVEYDTLP